jgi:hypothetical protein
MTVENTYISSHDKLDLIMYIIITGPAKLVDQHYLYIVI